MKKYSYILAVMGFFCWAAAEDEIDMQISTAEAEETEVILFTNLPEVSDDIIQERSRSVPVPFMSIPHNLPVEVLPDLRTTSVYNASVRQPLVASPSPTVSFQALNDTLTVIPPDTQGAVGVNHIMTTLNDRVRIQSKTGTILRTVSLKSFWGTTNTTFDPKITYDPFSNRWIFVTLSTPASPSSMLFIAVSQTSDPLGAWYIFRIRADSTATSTSGVWVDFPSLGFNSKWIVVQANMFAMSTNSFSKSNIYVFDKQALYNNNSRYKLFSLSGIGATQAPAVTYDATNPTLYLLQNWNGNSSGSGILRLYTITGALGSETFSPVAFISKNSPWASSHSVIQGGFAPQRGTTSRIMNGDARMLGVVFRNGSIWAVQTVFLPAAAPTHSAIQWWQITPTGTIQQFNRIEDTSATASSGNFFAYPSIAVNMRNDVLIGYSHFNPLFYASGAYSFRFGTDLINTLRGSVFLKSGLATYVKDFGTGRIRWGDYSSSVVDPNGLDIWTLQEYADTHTSTDTSRWATWWGKISPLLPSLL